MKNILPFTSQDRPRSPPQERRLKRLAFLPNAVRNEGLAFIGEFGGTFMFLFIAFAATQVANAAAPPTQGASLSQYPNSANLLYISLAFGFSLAVNAWAFFRISGGLFNPAVTLGLYLIGAIGPLRAVNVFIAQFLSAICSAGIVSALFPGPLNVNTTLTGQTSISQGLFIEMFLTAELCFVIFMLAAEKHKATFLAPVGIGLALFVSEMCGVYFTGGSLNPARSFGPACITEFKGYHWIYWLGPTLGSLLAVGFYKLMKFGEYETVNPGQDFDDHEDQLFAPPAAAVTAEDVARPNVPAATTEAALSQQASGDLLSLQGSRDILNLEKSPSSNPAGAALSMGMGVPIGAITSRSSFGSAGGSRNRGRSLVVGGTEEERKAEMEKRRLAEQEEEEEEERRQDAAREGGKGEKSGM